MTKRRQCLVVPLLMLLTIFRLNNLAVPKYVITFAWSNKKATLTEDMSKKSIRFFNDREVRAVWDEEHNKWWFSATDIVRAINDEIMGTDS